MSSQPRPLGLTPTDRPPSPADFGPWHEGQCRTCRREFVLVVGTPADERCGKCWRKGQKLAKRDTSADAQEVLFDAGPYIEARRSP
jgi:hypothetical protein